MRRLIVLAAAAAAVVTPVFAFPSPASATPGPITALPHKVALGGSPWLPSGELVVDVGNGGAEQKGAFVVHLPHTVKLEPTKRCRAADGDGSTWICDTDTIPAGGSRTYTLAVTSTIPEPAFGISDEGWVEGRTTTGEASNRVEFTIAWPDKLPLRLAATSGPVKDGFADVEMRVTNAGTFTMGGYSLMVKFPKGLTVVSPRCDDSGRMDGVGCEIYRPGPLKAGATDRFTVRMKVTTAPVTVPLFLAPTNRYTNKDTKLDLTLKAAPATTDDDAGPTLPVTGSRTTPILFATGGALVVAGAGILLALRRRRFVAG
jgi:LPXTG-motif cell wall-anchored protein